VEGASGYILSRGNRPEGAVTAIAGNLVTSTFTDSSVTDGLTYTYQVQAFSPGGVSPHSAASVAEAGLAAHYPLEGAGLDDSHGDLGGATSGADYPPVGVRGGGARFDGIDDYLQLPPSIHQDFTIACWVKTTDTGDGGQWWAGKGLVDAEVSGSTSDFGLALVGDTAAFGAGNPDTTLTASTPINDDRWHHVAATRDDASGEMQIYIDGALEGVTFGPTGPRNAPPSLRLGSIQTGTGFFAGAMDDIRLYRYRLDAAAVATLASSPNGPLRFLTADAIGPAFLATGTGGIPGHSYILRSTSTPAAPLPTWIPVQTNLFGANGSFTLTNVTNQGNLPRFYRIDQ